MSKRVLNPDKMTSIPTFTDAALNTYIRLDVPDDWKEKGVVTIYQQVKIDEAGTIKLVGTAFEVYDADIIGIELNPGETTFLEEGVEIAI